MSEQVNVTFFFTVCSYIILKLLCYIILKLLCYIIFKLLCYIILKLLCILLDVISSRDVIQCERSMSDFVIDDCP